MPDESQPAQQPQWSPSSLDGFVLDRVLLHDANTKVLVVVGSFAGREGQALLKLTRQDFTTDAAAIDQQLLTAATQLQLDFHNDIYYKFNATVPPPHGLVSIDVTYPATAKHIAKCEEQSLHLVRETPDMYKDKVLPWIQATPPQRLQWVYNILEKKAEVERLLFEDPDPDTGFMLHPDLKWDQVTTQQLYCVVLCHRRDVPCLRALTAAHLPLLKNIRDKAAQAILDKYQVPADQLRMYVHYPPSYYHFHVHVVHVKSYGFGSTVGKAHLLADIIDNIETCGSDYYQRRNLTLQLGENDELWQQLSCTSLQDSLPAKRLRQA